jgi:hypothetical protein
LGWKKATNRVKLVNLLSNSTENVPKNAENGEISAQNSENPPKNDDFSKNDDFAPKNADFSAKIAKKARENGILGISLREFSESGGKISEKTAKTCVFFFFFFFFGDSLMIFNVNFFIVFSIDLFLLIYTSIFH